MILLSNGKYKNKYKTSLLFDTENNNKLGKIAKIRTSLAEEKNEMVLYYLYRKADSKTLVIHSPDSRYPLILPFVPLLWQTNILTTIAVPFGRFHNTDQGLSIVLVHCFFFFIMVPRNFSLPCFFIFFNQSENLTNELLKFHFNHVESKEKMSLNLQW